MPSILDEGRLEALCGRLATLRPDSQARWGRMNAGSMLAHLSLSARMALGELEVASKSKRVFQVFPLKHLILYVVPFPKGAPTAPELLAGAAGAFEADRQALVELVQRIGTGPREGAGPAHPLFGPLSRAEWGAATHKHMDHHLRQFGV